MGKYIVIGGDFAPTQSNQKLFAEGKIQQLIGNELYELMEKAEYRVFNLEIPFLNEGKPIKKCGPSICADSETILGIKAVKPSILSLANNHILDYGKEGLETTLRLLQENGIDYIGAGFDLEEAAKPQILECEGKKIGIYACAEHEFSAIGYTNKFGANPFEPLRSLNEIEELKKQCNYLIVLFHGGAELYRYPTPEQQNICHKMVEKGADLVLCQHSHCIGAVEEYRNAHILYGQGNFLFDYKNIEEYQTGLLVKIDVENMELEYIPVKKQKNGIRLASLNEKDKILNGLKERADAVKRTGFVEEMYNHFAVEQAKLYLYRCSGVFGLTIRLMEKLLKINLFNVIFSEKRLLFLLSIFRCETHRERVIRGLEAMLYESDVS